MNNIKSILHQTRQIVSVILVLILLCGLIFPLVLTGLSQLLFPKQANGSIIEINGTAVGSEFVGQEFTKPYFMKGRPSAVHYNTYTEDANGNKIYSDKSDFSGLSSGSENLAPSNPKLRERVSEDIEKFLEENPSVEIEDIPTDLMTSSDSGLDPHISVKAAEIQIPAISKASGISEDELFAIVEDNTDKKLLGVFGEETVNVLGVNLDIAEKMGLF